ncbi:hypothetical protein H310_06550 [Aphanomyces invadans]|uniref:Reverse transcriptase zinc-binding domain-containing protein n=1 Tax=Aphanomyces invadans TaxID=157072 RepID=A0A024U8V9_9STRA|nr:hypothetical protein H310_06550 [Aphanomyces invadans]ETW02038.1 hypothetical protein H310_06550 [Aphanomyces invadans]|eukprot:XP_008869886.1 hypothetical protein H310_06550 [Aphanomyces invadans]
MADSSLIPTKHLNLSTNFSADPKRRSSSRYFPYLFKFHVPQPTCVFCGSIETYHHFLFICRYGQSVWQYFKKIQQILECPFPRNELELFFELPKPPDGYYVRGYLKIWPIVRACVYYQIWLQRADLMFRPDLPLKTPLETAIHAASLNYLNLMILIRDLPPQKGYTKVFNVLRVLSDIRG